MTVTTNPAGTLEVQRDVVAVPAYFHTPHVHPYDEVEWHRVDVEQKNWRTGDVVFEQAGVEFPTTWDRNSIDIVTTKYFRGTMGTPARENSLKQLIDRVVNTYVESGIEHRYFTADTGHIFGMELTWLLLHQHFAFNSPVWFNVGTTSPQVVSACFILAVEDTMDSILNWYREEGLIFKGGSGAGLNLSRIRSSKELLKSSGGTASGPVSFMRGADASAGTIKSGGATRRAAKMVVLDVDHPDVEEFIETKWHEEEKIRALRDAGFDMELGGKDIVSVQYQNANNSVRVSDTFMKAVQDGTSFDLTARTDGRTVETVDARELWNKLCEAAWSCADPGIQYGDTINDWHTNPNTGPITASNPCSEFLSLDNSSCNLASLNLLKFVDPDDTFNTEKFTHAVGVIITAMDISIAFADFPTEKITQTTRDYRQLGIGYANLGALLMRRGLPYNSPEGRALAASITSLMTSAAYRQSAQIAAVVGPYPGFESNRAEHTRVLLKHKQAALELVGNVVGIDTAPFVEDGLIGQHEEAAAIAAHAAREWDTCMALGADHGWRNAQASLLAPTGTIGFMMGCDTTGIEPDFSLLKSKKLVGGGSMQIVNQQVPASLKALGYSQTQIADIMDSIEATGDVYDTDTLNKDHRDVFACATGHGAIEPMGHIRMMAAVQPFLSGAISKTVNMPEAATIDDVERIYTAGWHLGLKALAIYRDNCKVGQPLTSSATAAATASASAQTPVRQRMPKSRDSRTTSFNVGGADGYVTAGRYDDGTLGEVFVKMSKQGSTLAGVMDAFSIAVSIGLQYGVPLETYVSKFTNMRFEPSGMTDDPDIRMAHSMLDYLFRRLALDHLDHETRAGLGTLSARERAEQLAEPAPLPSASPRLPASVVELSEALSGKTFDAPICFVCGIKMQPSGSCFTCPGCFGTSGCS